MLALRIFPLPLKSQRHPDVLVIFLATVKPLSWRTTHLRTDWRFLIEVSFVRNTILPATIMIGPAFYQISDDALCEETSPLFPGAHSRLLDLMAEILAGMKPGDCGVERAPDHKARVATHLRHCLGTYQAFLDGLANRRIDFRDALPHVESRSCRDVLDYVMELHSRLVREAGPLPPCTRLVVRQHGGPWLESSLARESAYLEDHTRHHCMWVALALQQQEGPMPRVLEELCDETTLSTAG